MILTLWFIILNNFLNFGQNADLLLKGRLFVFCNSILEGTVQNISLVPQKDTYLVEISVNDSLSTTYGKSIVLQQEMEGTANIITEDRRMIARLFDKLKDLLKSSWFGFIQKGRLIL